MPSYPAGWHSDPSRRHEHRYFDGSQWTIHVSDQGVQSQDSPDWWQQADHDSRNHRSAWSGEMDPGLYRIHELQMKIARLQREVNRLTRRGRSKASSAKFAGFLGGAAGREAQSKYSQAQIKQNEIMMLQAELDRLMHRV